MPCYFLGSALHTSLGSTLATQLQALRNSPTPPGTVTVRYADKSQELPYKLLADCNIDHAAERMLRVVDPLINEALDAAKLTPDERSNMGLFLGTSSFDISISEEEYRKELMHNSAAVALSSCSSQGVLGNGIRKRHGIRGPDFSFNTACTASANALIYADAMIRSGRLQHALVVGIEMHNALTALGFHGLQLLTSSTMKPFDRSRNGLVLGEGCSVLALGNRPSSPQRWHLKGSANVCDTHSVSATNPDGSIVANVIRNAIDRSALQPHEISAIKVHGTASLLNDEAEAAGMKRVFSNMPALTAIKPFIGHTLGACGLNELLLFCAAADEGFLIGTPGIGNNGDEQGDAKLGVTLNQQAHELPPGHFLMNYFGFGGNNTALVISNVRAKSGE